MRELIKALPGYGSSLVEIGGNNVILYHPTQIPVSIQPALDDQYNVPEMANPIMDFAMNRDSDHADKDIDGSPLPSEHENGSSDQCCSSPGHLMND